MSFLLLVIVSVHPAAAGAAPGDIDPSFGQGGRVVVKPEIFGVLGQEQAPSSMLVGRDDSIYVFGNGGEHCGNAICGRFGVRRFRKNGSLDRSYAPVPLVLPPTRAEPDGGGGALGMDAKDDVLAAFGLADGFEVLRLRPDGSRDPSFGIDGVAKTTLGFPVWVGALGLDPDGHILISGTVANPAPQGGYPNGGEVFLARLTEDGLPDPAFASGGTTRIPYAGLDFEAPSAALSVGGDGALVGVGWDRRNRSVVHVDGGGRFRGILGIGPFPAYIPGRQRRELTSILQDGNRILTVGETESGTFVTALHRNGRRDQRFGRNGISIDHAFEVGGQTTGLQDPAGRLVLGGAEITKETGAYGESVLRVAVSRLRPDGRLDRTFAAGVTKPWPWGMSYFSSSLGIGLQHGGRIVELGAGSPTCGRDCPPNNAFTLVRYVGGTSHVRCNGHQATIVGTRQGEKILGTSGSDVIAALGGEDVVHAGGGNDIICGGPGKDRIFGGPGQDRVVR